MTCRPDRATGSRARIIVQEEPCWGTLSEEGDPSVEQEALGWDFGSETLADPPTNIESTLLRDDRMRSAPQTGNHRPGGDVIGELQPNGPWALIFKHALTNSAGVSTSGSGPYVHSMEGSPDLDEGLTVEKYFAFPSGNSRILRYLGGRVNEWEIGVPNEGVVTARAGLLFREEALVNDSMDDSPTYPTNNEPFNSFQAVIYLDPEGDGSRVAVATVRSVTIRGSNAMSAEEFVLDGTGLRADIPEDERSINGDIEVMFTYDTYELYERTKDNTTVSMELVLTRGANSWHFTIPAMKLRINTPQVSGRGPLNLSGTFEAFRDEDSGTDIQLVITNQDPAISTAA